MGCVCVWGTSLGKVADEAQFLAVLQSIRHQSSDLDVVFFARKGFFSKHIFPGVRQIESSDLLAVIHALRNSGVLVMLGGCFMESPMQMRNCFGLLILARLLRVKVISFGTTAFPYKTFLGRMVYRYVMNRLEAIAVREKTSGTAIDELNVCTPINYFADPRFLFEPEKDVNNYLISQNIDLNRPLIGISIRNMHEAMPEWVKRSHGYTSDAALRSYRSIAVVLDELTTIAQIIVLPMASSLEEEEQAAARIQCYMRNSTQIRVLSPLHTPRLLGLVRSCDMVIASRLGAALFASVTGTPLLAIAYERRMLEFMTQVGCSEFVVDWKEMEADRFKQLVDRAWRVRDISKQKLMGTVSDLVQSASQGGKFLGSYIQ